MTVIIENTGFSVTHWARFDEQEFIRQNLKGGIFKGRSDEDRIELLKQTYQLIRDASRNAKTA